MNENAPKGVGEQTGAASSALAMQAMALSNNVPEVALTALMIASCWIAKGCATPGIPDPQILEMLKSALSIVAPGAFTDLDTWRKRQAEAKEP